MNTLLSNLMDFKNNPHASYAIWGAIILEMLKIWLPPGHEEQIAATQKILTWYGVIAATKTGGTPPGNAAPVTNQAAKAAVPVALILFCSLVFSPARPVERLQSVATMTIHPGAHNAAQSR